MDRFYVLWTLDGVLCSRGFDTMEDAESFAMDFELYESRILSGVVKTMLTAALILREVK